MKNLFPEIPCLKGERVTLKKITAADASGLSELINNDNVYRYLPTFLFERRYADIDEVIAKLYTEIITASTMVENKASARVLRKNGFDLVVSAVGEDWGYEELTIADKWIR